MHRSTEKLHPGTSAILGIGLVLSLLLTASLPAHSGGEVESRKASGPITIDGNLDEWADALDGNSPLNDIVVDPQDWYRILPRDQMPGTGNTNNGGLRVSRGSIGGDADFSARWATMWDDEYLYFAFDVTDDSVNPYAGGTATREGDIDGIWLCFDTKHDAPVFDFPEGFSTKHAADNSTYQADDEFWSFAPLTAGGDGIGWLQGNSDPVFSNAANGHVAGQVTDQGYTAEIRMPWSVFQRPFGGALVPTDGMVVGFDITMMDIDGDPPTYAAGEGGAMSWSSDFENDNTPGVLGNLIIREAPKPVIAQTSDGYLYWEGEWFDRTTGPTLFEVRGRAAASGGAVMVSPPSADPLGSQDNLLIYRMTFSSEGEYHFYLRRTNSGDDNDSLYPPPGFDADPVGEGATNRWNELLADDWTELGIATDFNGSNPPTVEDAAGYFDTGSFTYGVTADNVANGDVLEFRIKGREGGLEIDRLVLHKQSGLTSAELDALTLSQGPPTVGSMQGDCNSDGGVDIADVICLVETLFAGFNLLGPSSPGLPCSTDGGNIVMLDVSGSGAIDVADIVGLAGALFGGGAPPGCVMLDAGLGCGQSPACQ